MSFLVMDVGNSRLKWGLYDQPRPHAVLLTHGVVALEAVDSLFETVWRQQPRPQEMLGCFVASEAVRARVEEQLGAWGVSPRWVKAQPCLAGLTNTYAHPYQLGADRWLAMIGALHRTHPDLAQAAAPRVTRPLVVVMVGTAVTIDAVDDRQHFIGGLILPGFGLMLRALELGTAGLRVPSGEVRDFPDNTSDALMSGGTDAIAGAIERSLRRLRKHTGHEPMLIMSGGAVSRLSHVEELPASVVENLIFEGLLTLASSG